MATIVAPATPQRPLPGAYMATPAPSAPTIFAQQAASLRQTLQPTPAATTTNGAATTHPEASPVQQAAKTINDALASETRFPDLESYITSGSSSDYEMTTNPAWLPFQKLKMYDLPPRILEQATHTGMGVFMGIFPALGHAWVALDNCLYLWDYTMPNPDLIGFEENLNTILAIKLVKPKEGVFVKEIKHVIVVSTSAEMLLLGVATQTTATGANTIALYNTHMSISIRGLQVDVIEASKTGRIFFAGSTTDDIYELQYQQEEGWFRGRTSRICHTKQSYALVPESLRVVGQIWGKAPEPRRQVQILIDDTRRLLYTLSSTSEIRVYAMKDQQIVFALRRTLASLLQNTSNITLRTDLLHSREVSVVSLSAVSVDEASRLSVMATTNTGCRLYMSATQGYGNSATGDNPPNMFQILHIRFPPKDPNELQAQLPAGQSAVTTYNAASGTVHNTSRVMEGTNMAYRIPPGYFFAFKSDAENMQRARVFCAAPDSARLKNPSDSTRLDSRFQEFGQWIQLSSELQQLQLMTDEFCANKSPVGFGNEMAVQFDKTSTEFGIMTSTGIQTVRRRRLVDVFAGLMRYASADEEGREGDIRRFIRMYGRIETAATAIAVACGQGVDVSPDSRITAVTDPEVIDGARKAFIDHGGSPQYNANAVDNNTASGQNVVPSPRHDGLALYMSRLIRSIWKSKVIREEQKPGEPLMLKSVVELEKLRGIQRDLNTLSDFLNRNKGFIEGLAGPQGLGRAASRQEELAQSGEHRAMHSLYKLIESIVEGISFVLMLFDEKVEEIVALIPDESKRATKELTFESIITTAAGKDLAKELVKAIVHRNIANGSNVETVADALRRRCGSFCSADDVLMFKAQQQVNQASASGSQSETGRVLLNESQRLYQKIAGTLTNEHLEWAVGQYVQMEFYAGAIQLCLVVAQEKDKAKQALAWLKDDFPEPDARKESFEKRNRCYTFIFRIIEVLDERTSQEPQTMDGHYTLAAKRRNEAYDVVNRSDDAVFQTCLYEWYIADGKAERLLDIDTPYIVEYLKRMSERERAHADLLWKYFARHNDYLQAAAVQLLLAQDPDNNLTLGERVSYLSRARTNASTRQTALMDPRQSKQQLLREISDLLDVANIQDDLLERMKAEPRLTAERRPQILEVLNGPILPVEELFNRYADQAQYHDICLLIFYVADHRNPVDIKNAWDGLIQSTNDEAIAAGTVPFEVVGERIRSLGRRLNTSDAVFPIHTLVPMLEAYFIAPREQRPANPNWPLDLLIKEPLSVPHETVLPVLEGMYYGNEAPFNTPSKRRVLGGQLVYLLHDWARESERRGERVICGSDENASMVVDCLKSLARSGELESNAKVEAERLAAEITAQVSR